MDDLLRELSDRRAIEDGIAAYAHALDRRAWDELAGCLAGDVRARYGDGPWLEGLDAVTAWCRRVLERLDASQHRTGTVRVELAGDRARSSCYVAAEHLRSGAPGGDRFTVGGSYEDVWERGAEGWRIARRVMHVTWTDGNPNVLAR